MEIYAEYNRRSAPVSFEAWSDIHTKYHDANYIYSKILNLCLTEKVYNDKSIKYSNSIESYQYDNIWDFIQEGRHRLYNGYGATLVDVPGNADNDSMGDDKEQKKEEEEEEKYDIIHGAMDNNQTLRDKHILGELNEQVELQIHASSFGSHINSVHIH